MNLTPIGYVENFYLKSMSNLHADGSAPKTLCGADINDQVSYPVPLILLGPSADQQFPASMV
jgi:hypothetical protein